MKTMLMSNRVLAFGLQAKLFRGLSDQSRLAILEAPLSGPMPACEIVEATGLSQTKTSNHLRCFCDCDLVAAEQERWFDYCYLSKQRAETLLRLAKKSSSNDSHGSSISRRVNEK